MTKLQPHKTPLCPGAQSAPARDYFKLRAGLPNCRTVFERTGKGRVAFMGGSITEMVGWRELVCAGLQRRFPGTKFDFINAGISSTGSAPGAFRLVRDVFGKGKIDLLFEEAAVNDLYNGTPAREQVRAMEGIVRHARDLNPAIDIVLLHFADPLKLREYNSGRTPAVIRNHESVAIRYRVPSVNLALEVAERIRRGEFTWENDFKGLHPAPFGHKLYADTIARLFDAAWSGPISRAAAIEPHRQPRKLDKFCYASGVLLPVNQAIKTRRFAVDPRWRSTDGAETRPGFVAVPMLIGDQAGAGFALAFTGSAVGLLVAAGPDAGAIEFRIDKGRWQAQDLFTKWSDRLHIPWLYILKDALPGTAKHRLDVRIAAKRNPASKGHACRIVNFAVNLNNP